MNINYEKFLNIFKAVEADLPIPVLPTSELPYKFGKDFGSELVKTHVNLNLFNLLPEGSESKHIQINEFWIACNTYRGNIPRETPSGKFALGYVYGALFNMKTQLYHYHYSPLGLDFSEDINFDNFTDDVKPAARVVMNALLYLHSGTPDLREYKVPQASRRIRDDHIRRYGKEPCILVGYDWKKPRLEHSVRGHWRWQPYGEKLSKVKLIWIDAHNRGVQVDQDVISISSCID